MFLNMYLIKTQKLPYSGEKKLCANCIIWTERIGAYIWGGCLLIKAVRACVYLFKEKTNQWHNQDYLEEKPQSGVSKSKINQKDTLKKSPRNTMLNHLVSLLTRARVSSVSSIPAGNTAVIKKSDRLGTISLAVFWKENSGVQRFKRTDLTIL